MNIATLLFSPLGRLQRGTYLLLSLITGLFALILQGLLIANQMADAPLSDLVLILIQPWRFGFAPVAIFAVELWAHICLAFKRSRDITGSGVLGWVFAVLVAAPWVASGLAGQGGFGQSPVVTIMISFPLLLVSSILVFKGSRTENNEGARQSAAASVKHDWREDAGNHEPDMTLIRRAAELRAAETPATPTPALSDPQPSVRTTGGRPSFGQRRNGRAAAMGAGRAARTT